MIRRLVLVGVLLALLLFACRTEEAEDGAGDAAAVAESAERFRSP